MNSGAIISGLQRAWRFRTSIVLFIISLAFILYAPIIPHVPYCSSSWKPIIYFSSHLSESYRNELIVSRNQDRQTFLAYNDQIFITLSDWRDVESWMLNRMEHSVENVGRSAFEAFPEGETGRLYREWTEAERAYFKGHVDLEIRNDALCALIKQVVTPK